MGWIAHLRSCTEWMEPFLFKPWYFSLQHLFLGTKKFCHPVGLMNSTMLNECSSTNSLLDQNSRHKCNHPHILHHQTIMEYTFSNPNSSCHSQIDYFKITRKQEQCLCFHSNFVLWHGAPSPRAALVLGVIREAW